MAREPLGVFLRDSRAPRAALVLKPNGVPGPCRVSDSRDGRRWTGKNSIPGAPGGPAPGGAFRPLGAWFFVAGGYVGPPLQSRDAPGWCDRFANTPTSLIHRRGTIKALMISKSSLSSLKRKPLQVTPRGFSCFGLAVPIDLDDLHPGVHHVEVVGLEAGRGGEIRPDDHEARAREGDRDRDVDGRIDDGDVHRPQGDDLDRRG